MGHCGHDLAPCVHVFDLRLAAGGRAEVQFLEHELMRLRVTVKQVKAGHGLGQVILSTSISRFFFFVLKVTRRCPTAAGRRRGMLMCSGLAINRRSTSSSDVQ